MSAKFDQKSMEAFVIDHLSYRVQAPESIGAMLDFEFRDCSAEEGTLTLIHRVEEREVNIYNTLHGGNYHVADGFCHGNTLKSIYGI